MGWENPPPPLWKIAAGGLRGEKKEGKKGNIEREKKKKEKEGKEEGKKWKRNSKLKVFLKYSFWLGVQAR